MAKLNVPENAIPVLLSIADMADAKFDALMSALSASKPSLSPSDFISQTATALNQDNNNQTAAIIGTVFTLYRFKDAKRLSSEEVAEEISRISVAKGLSESKSDSLKKRLILLLGFEHSVAVTAKALDVMTEHEHVFCSARILSDIRPVFTSSLDAPEAAVIVHNLEIGFHDKSENRHREFYVALDIHDIQKLKDILDRASKKTAALETIIANSKLPHLKP
jgi:hypothetical protein